MIPDGFVSSAGRRSAPEDPLRQWSAMQAERSERDTGHQSAAPFPRDQSRLEMMRRIKRMSARERVALFDRLSRDAAWVRSATRVR